MTGRIRFANQLRGVAAVSVAISHLIGIYWVVPDVVSAITFSPAPGGAPPAVLGIVSQPWFNFGPFGVALFFLISGMVVPFSLDRHTRLSFLAARVLRIYPTYLVALLIEVGLQYGSASLWHRPFTTPWTTILANVLLVYDVVGHPSLDLVNWTLSVEFKFYLLVILLAGALRTGLVWPLPLTCALILGLNAAIAAGLVGDAAALPSSVTHTLSTQSLCVSYMLIGTAFNLHVRGRVGTLGLTALVGVLTVMFVATWRVGLWGAQYPIVTVNYLYALALFSLLYAVRNRVPANPVLDAMAAISFPFYLVHSLVGYLLLRALMAGANLAYGPALAIVVPTVLALSWVLHRVVETPTARAGRSFGLRLPKAPDAIVRICS